MRAFVWSSRFETGIASVDEQHRRLFDIVNDVGTMLVDAAGTAEEALQSTFGQLAEYARFHFADEERVMGAAGVDAAFAASHAEQHRRFAEQLGAMWQSRSAMSHPAEALHGFLAAWLSFHILGTDQSMARQIARVKAGMAPAAAAAAESAAADAPTAALLDALRALYGVLSLQNRDLAQANRGLEEKVAARTQALEAANAGLECERVRLGELLRQVQQAQSQLLEAEKMASIGQLAAGVAHEINNPVGFVNSNLGTLEHYAGHLLRLAELGAATPAGQALAADIDFEFMRGDLRDLLKESQGGMERVRRIVADLMSFSRVDAAEWRETDLRASLESALNVTWHELKYKVDIVRELEPLPLVLCIPAQISRVLVNLLVNAGQAIAQHGTITLRSGRAGDRVWLEVADSGCGMDEATRKRMFEPFFTTKPVGTGTGLGLSVTWDIIKKHGGEIEVASEPGRGSSFRVWLPAAGPHRGGESQSAGSAS